MTQILCLEISVLPLRAGAGGLDLGLELVHARSYDPIQASSRSL